MNGDTRIRYTLDRRQYESFAADMARVGVNAQPQEVTRVFPYGSEEWRKCEESGSLFHEDSERMYRLTEWREEAGSRYDLTVSLWTFNDDKQSLSNRIDDLLDNLYKPEPPEAVMNAQNIKTHNRMSLGMRLACSLVYLVMLSIVLLAAYGLYRLLH